MCLCWVVVPTIARLTILFGCVLKWGRLLCFIPCPPNNPKPCPLDCHCGHQAYADRLLQVLEGQLDNQNMYVVKFATSNVYLGGTDGEGV